MMGEGMAMEFVLKVTLIFLYITLRRHGVGGALVRVVHWMTDEIESRGGRPKSEVELMLMC